MRRYIADEVQEVLPLTDEAYSYTHAHMRAQIEVQEVLPLTDEAYSYTHAHI